MRTRIGVWLALCLGCAGCGANLGFGPSDYSLHIPCAAEWVVRGFQYQHFGSTPDTLLTATMHKGETVTLTLTTLNGVSCGDSLSTVQWVSTSPSVARVVPAEPTTATLTGIAPGETHVSAEVTLSNGTTRTAELHAVPSPGSPPLRVYAVRVVR